MELKNFPRKFSYFIFMLFFFVMFSSSHHRYESYGQEVSSSSSSSDACKEKEFHKESLLKRFIKKFKKEEKTQNSQVSSQGNEDALLLASQENPIERKKLLKKFQAISLQWDAKNAIKYFRSFPHKDHYELLKNYLDHLYDKNDFQILSKIYRDELDPYGLSKKLFLRKSAVLLSFKERKAFLEKI